MVSQCWFGALLFTSYVFSSSEKPVISLYMFGRTTPPPPPHVPRGNSRAQYAQIIIIIPVTIPKDSVHLLLSLGGIRIADNDEHVFCVSFKMTCFYLASLATWYCATCYNSVRVSLLLFPSHCDELMYTPAQQRRSLDASLNAALSSRRALLSRIKDNVLFFIFHCVYVFGDFIFQSCVEAKCT